MLSFTEFFKKKDPIVDIIEVDAKEIKIADYLIKNYKKYIGFKELEIDVTLWVLALPNYNLKVKNGDLIVIYRKSPYWKIVEKTNTFYQFLQLYKGKFKYW